MSKYTAIVRKKLSSPMTVLRSEVVGDCLDYGCGRGFDCDYLGIDGYDPNWRPDTRLRSYDRIFCNFVLNVVPPAVEKQIIAHVKALLKPSGIAFFTVRRDIKADYEGRGCTQRLVHLDMESFYINPHRYEIYRFTKENTQ